MVVGGALGKVKTMFRLCCHAFFFKEVLVQTSCSLHKWWLSLSLLPLMAKSKSATSSNRGSVCSFHDVPKNIELIVTHT